MAAIYLIQLSQLPQSFSLTRFVSENKGGGTEISQLFKYTPLFQPLIILDLYLRHMESLNEVVSRQAISAPLSHVPHHTFLAIFSLILSS